MTTPNTEAVEWLSRFTVLTGIEVGHTAHALTVAASCIDQGLTPTQARDRLERAGHNLNLLRAGGVLKGLQNLQPAKATRDHLTSVADVLNQDICDDHGGHLRAVCRGCRRATA